MVNMANLPQGKEFSLKGGVESIARGKAKSLDPVKSLDPALSLATLILISRCINALAFGVERQANPEKSPLYNAVLANNGADLGEGTTHVHSPEKTYAAVKEAEMMENVTMKSFISKGLGD